MLICLSTGHDEAMMHPAIDIVVVMFEYKWKKSTDGFARVALAALKMTQRCEDHFENISCKGIIDGVNE